MANDEIKGLTKDDLKDLITAATTAAVAAAMRPNAKEQKEIDDQIAADKRKSLMMVEMGKAEQEAMDRKKYGCSHSRHPMSAGKLGGHNCRKGTGEWTTGGQFCGKNPKTGVPYAYLVCTRCSFGWKWEPNVQELEYLQENGFMGLEPPEESRLLKEELVGA
jgi:hypothetical protein